MGRYNLVPDKSLSEIMITVILFVSFAVFLYLLYFFSRRPEKKQAIDVLESYFNRFSLSYDQKHVISLLFKYRKLVSIPHFFSDEYYYDSSVNDFLKILTKRKVKPEQIENMKLLYEGIKHKIKFKETKSFTSRDIGSGNYVKLQIDKIGFITGKIINNDDKGVLVNTRFHDEIENKIKDARGVKLYSWDERYQYELNSKMKRVNSKGQLNYFLVDHGDLVIKDKFIHGMKVKIKIPVFFTYIYDPVTKMRIKDSVLRGTINTFSIFGAEIFSRNYIDRNGIYLFEFHDFEDNETRLYFTGKIEDYADVHDGRLLFVRFIDMKEEVRKNVYRYIVHKMNSLSED